MILYKNTETLDDHSYGLKFSYNKEDAEIVILGSKSIDIEDFPKLKAIFRVGVGKDNISMEDAKKRSVIVRFPSKKTIDYIYDETASFTCGLIFRMLYQDSGSIDPWKKNNRKQFKDKKLLIIGTGNIGKRVFNHMNDLMKVMTFDICDNSLSELDDLLITADCITLHIPNSTENNSFFNRQKLSLLKNNATLINTSRAAIVDEDALYSEIKENRIRAAFDVFWKEPYEGKLSEYHPNKFYMTPHIASTCTGFLEGCRKDLDKLIIELSDD